MNERQIFCATLLAACVACTGAEAPPSPGTVASATESVEAPRLLRLPRPYAATEPLAEWLRDLVTPRLSTLSGLTPTCAARDKMQLVVPLNGQNLICSDLLEMNKGGPVVIDCPAPDRLRVQLGAFGPCLPGPSALVALASLRLPNGRGYFLSAPTTSATTGAVDRLEPNVAAYPSLEGTLNPIELVAPADAERIDTMRLRRPAPETWLAANIEDGLFALELTIEGRSTLDPQKREWLLELSQSEAITAGPPKLFVPRPRLHEPPKTPLSQKPVAASTEKKTPVFFYVAEAPTEEPYAGACAYVRQWLHARQVVATRAARNARMIPLGCRFRHIENFPIEPALAIVRLPLPLVNTETGVFPVKTYEESRSMTVLQSLMR